MSQIRHESPGISSANLTQNTDEHTSGTDTQTVPHVQVKHNPTESNTTAGSADSTNGSLTNRTKRSSSSSSPTRSGNNHPPITWGSTFAYHWSRITQALGAIFCCFWCRDSNDTEVRTAKQSHDLIQPPLAANAPSVNVSANQFASIIQRTKDLGLSKLNFISQRDKVEEEIKPVRAEYLKQEKALLKRVQKDLRACYDANGQLDVQKFRDWYGRYEKMVDELVDGTVNAHIAHAKSGLLISAKTDNTFTENEQLTFAHKTRAEGEKAKSLVKGFVRFPGAEKFNGLLNKNGTPNFSSKAWEHPNLVNQFLGKEKLQFKDTMLTRELKRHEEDVIGGIGGFQVNATLDGVPKDKLELLRKARGQFANEVNLDLKKELQLVESELSNTKEMEKIEKLEYRQAQLKAATYRQDVLETLPQVLSDKYKELSSKDAKHRGEFHSGKFDALKKYVTSEEFQNAQTPADKIKAMPLEFINDICTACNLGQIMRKGLGDSLNQQHDFIRIQEADHFLPFEVFQELASPRNGEHWGYVKEGDNAIAYNKNRFKLVEPKQLGNDLSTALTDLEETCKSNHAQVALFQRKDSDPAKYALQVNMHLPSSNRDQNPGFVSKNLKAAEKAAEAFENFHKNCEFIINIGGDINATSSQLDDMDAKLPDGFNSPLSFFFKQRNLHPQYNVQFAKADPQLGDVLSSYSSGKRVSMVPLVGETTASTGDAMTMDFKTTSKGDVVFDVGASHMVDHAVNRTTSDSSKGLIRTLDVNELASCTKKFAHSLPENAQNHTKNLPVNGVIKFNLLNEIWQRAAKAYE